MSNIIQEYKCSCGFNINGIEGNSRDVNSRQILHEKRCPVHIEENRKIIEARREEVIQDYKSAEKSNHRKYLEGDEKATEEYIYPNQKMDANEIIKEFYKNGRRVISITKKTKVGMDGLMIEVVMLMTTHVDDSFAINPANVRIITGMSNVAWERDMKEKTPNCFKDKIFHHGQLQNANLHNLRDALIIIDELDSGDKELSVLHKALKDAELLDIEYMEKNNIRFMFASATMIKELYHLYRWGDLHKNYRMTIPPNYIGHIEFLRLGIIQEFYNLNTFENADKWIKKDILDNYKNDYRVHIVRVNNKTEHIIQNACIHNKIQFHNHTSTDRLSSDEMKILFIDPLQKHQVIAVKGLLRRANLIPNIWKLRIGATHEFYTKKVDNNVQDQGIPGRISGYWRDIIEKGHKTGPHRTSIRSVEESENVYNDPFGLNSYQTNGFTKKKGKVNSSFTMLSTKNIKGLIPVDLPEVPHENVDINSYRIYDNEEVVKKVCSILEYYYRTTPDNINGFKETSLNESKSVVLLKDAIRKVPTAYGTNNGVKTYRTYYPCYIDITNKETLRFVVIIRPGTDPLNIQTVDTQYPSIKYTS